MKNSILLFAATAMTMSSCTRALDTDVLAAYPDIPEVFLDEFASDLQYQAWGKVTNFSIDYNEQYEGRAAMCIEVPVPSDPEGNFAGGIFYSSSARNLSGYDALTFYVKSSISASMTAGIGNFGDTAYNVSVENIPVSTNWTQVIIPIPNPAKLTAEQGLFYYSAGAVDGESYTIWIDEVKYEKLGTLAHTRIQDMTMAGFPSGDIEIGELTVYVNLPDGTDCEMTASSAFFSFESSAPETATVENGAITFHGGREIAVLTPAEAGGSITVTGIYDFAPAPEHEADEVISLYCDDYVNVLSSPFNGYWAPYQTTTNDEMVLGDNHVMHYGSFNFVGIVLDKDADCTGKTHVHLDVLLQDTVEGQPQLDISDDINCEGVPAGKVTVNLETGDWIPVDVPLNVQTVIHQLQLDITENTPAYLNILVDNIYFY